MLSVLSVIGTRPEAIKMAPVVTALRAEPSVQHTLCTTAQHREMLDQTLAAFGLVPDFDLNLMEPGQSLASLTARIVMTMSRLLTEIRPDWVLVQGDTTTVFGAALSAFYAGVRVGHVEAGLRSFNTRQPFPEEINRVLTGRLADLHFAPTATAKTNLESEGIPAALIAVTGNPVVDALRMTEKFSAPAPVILEGIRPDQRIILVTCHRRENFGGPLREIFGALRAVCDRHPDVRIVYPVHPNPSVRDVAHAMLDSHPSITLLPPLDYLPLVHLMRRSYFAITDSGGIQEEAPALGKPVLVVREVTERPEAVQAGTVKVVGTTMARIVEAACELLTSRVAYERMARSVNPYGDGHAAERIVSALLGRSFQEFSPTVG